MTIELILSGSIATIRLNRPPSRNALRSEDWVDLATLIERIDLSEVRVAILTGAGTSFCAGADLKELARLAEEERMRPAFRTSMRQGLDAIGSSKVPIVAMIQGDCHGAGVALAMACDIRVAAPAARFSIPPARFGILYPQEDVDRLVRLVGPGQASRILLSAVAIDAGEAARIGLVDVEAESADALAAAIAENDPGSVAALRAQIAGLPPAEAATLFERSFGTARFRMTAAAIQQRRK